MGEAAFSIMAKSWLWGSQIAVKESDWNYITLNLVVFFYAPWKFYLPDVFQKVLKETSAMKWVKDIFNKYVNKIGIHAFSITVHAFLSRSALVLKKNFMASFYGWGSTASRLEPLRGDSLLFTTKSPKIPGTHFIDLRRMKWWVDLRATWWFWTLDPWIGNPAP